MPTDQPNNAPNDLPADAREETDAAKVIADEGTASTPGGGGSGGAAAADAAGQRQRAATPNTPAEPPTPHDASSLDAADEAALLSDTPEAHLRSQ